MYVHGAKYITNNSTFNCKILYQLIGLFLTCLHDKLLLCASFGCQYIVHNGV